MSSYDKNVDKNKSMIEKRIILLFYNYKSEKYGVYLYSAPKMN